MITIHHVQPAGAPVNREISPEWLAPCGEFGPNPEGVANWLASAPVVPALLNELGLAGCADAALSDAQVLVRKPIGLGNEYGAARNAACDVGMVVVVTVWAPSVWVHGFARLALNEDGTRGAVILRPRRELPDDEDMAGFAFRAAGGIPDVD